MAEGLEESRHAVKAAAVRGEGNAFSLFQQAAGQVQLSVRQIPGQRDVIVLLKQPGYVFPAIVMMCGDLGNRGNLRAVFIHISPDALNQGRSQGKPVLVGGSDPLRTVFVTLLKEAGVDNPISVPEETATVASSLGALAVYRTRKASGEVAHQGL